MPKFEDFHQKLSNYKNKEQNKKIRVEDQYVKKNYLNHVDIINENLQLINTDQ